MTSFNLTQRIWLSFSLLVLFVGVVIAVVYPMSIQKALKDQSYKMIEREQLRMVIPNFEQFFAPGHEVNFIERRDAARSVGHLVVVNNLGKLEGDPVPREVLEHMGQRAFRQQEDLGRYELTYEGATLFYVVRKITPNNENAFLISYMWDTYLDEMVKTLWVRMLWVLLIAGILGLIMTVWLARYLRHPLILLGNRFEEIAKRNWQTSFKWKRDDEFGHLSDQFEHMRQNLLRYDRSQKTFIQHASHELKTPIMVINSYAQSVKDGMMPKGNLEETMDVIVNESERMEQRVEDLIYYSKLDTLIDDTPERDEVVFGTEVKAIVERLRVQREDVTFRIEGEETSFHVDREQWQVMLENLLENAMRYAESEIVIKASADMHASTLDIYNDGQSIPEEETSHLFDPFYKGSKGKFGLGLAIVKRIVELHDGNISFTNERNGVRFIIHLPKRFRGDSE